MRCLLRSDCVCINPDPSGRVFQVAEHVFAKVPQISGFPLQKFLSVHLSGKCDIFVCRSRNTTGVATLRDGAVLGTKVRKTIKTL